MLQAVGDNDDAINDLITQTEKRLQVVIKARESGIPDGAKSKMVEFERCVDVTMHGSDIS